MMGRQDGPSRFDMVRNEWSRSKRESRGCLIEWSNGKGKKTIHKKRRMRGMLLGRLYEWLKLVLYMMR